MITDNYSLQKILRQRLIGDVRVVYRADKRYSFVRVTRSVNQQLMVCQFALADTVDYTDNKSIDSLVREINLAFEKADA